MKVRKEEDMPRGLVYAGEKSLVCLLLTRYWIYWKKVVELVGGGYVINGAYPV